MSFLAIGNARERNRIRSVLQQPAQPSLARRFATTTSRPVKEEANKIAEVAPIRRKKRRA